MRISFLRLARRELFVAADWYEGRKEGLGSEFYAEVNAALSLVGELPDAHPSLGEDLRRVLLRRFPYALIYHRDGDTIVVVACAHTKRRPGYWKRRLR